MVLPRVVVILGSILSFFWVDTTIQHPLPYNCQQLVCGPVSSSYSSHLYFWQVHERFGTFPLGWPHSQEDEPLADLDHLLVCQTWDLWCIACRLMLSTPISQEEERYQLVPISLIIAHKHGKVAVVSFKFFLFPEQSLLPNIWFKVPALIRVNLQRFAITLVIKAFATVTASWFGKDTTSGHFVQFAVISCKVNFHDYPVSHTKISLTKFEN